jgi:hypothetical protein
MICPPHRFVIGRPAGPLLTGKCRCGERKTWPATPETMAGAAAARRRGTLQSRRKA